MDTDEDGTDLSHATEENKMEVDEGEMSSSQLLDPPSPIKEGIFDVYEEAALFLNDGHRGTPFSEYLKRQNATTLLPLKSFTPKTKPNGKYGAWIPLFLVFFQQTGRLCFCQTIFFGRLQRFTHRFRPPFNQGIPFIVWLLFSL